MSSKKEVRIEPALKMAKPISVDRNRNTITLLRKKRFNQLITLVVVKKNTKTLSGRGSSST